MKEASEIHVKTTTVTYRALSLGAGVQSSVLALLLSRGDPRLVKLGYPKPNIAIFADTGWEPDYVYRHLEWLKEQLQYPVIRVAEGNLKTNLKKGQTVSGHGFIDVPLFTIEPDGKKGMLRRQCTTHYKIKPIYREIRRRAGGRRGRPFPKDSHAEMWIGISRDEATRIKPSREPWVVHRWPLVDIGMTRLDCLEWFRTEYPDRHLPRSACVICPYRSNETWLELKQFEPASYEKAARFDRWLRNSSTNPVRKLLTGIPYLHASRRPLNSVIAEQDAASPEKIDLFTEECEGHCGV